MKNLNNFPNPILINDNTDYVNSSFNIEKEKIDLEEDNIVIDINYYLTNRTLEELINSKKACVIVKIECTSTPFRQIFKFDTNSKKLIVKIPNNEVTTRISAIGYIIATENIPEFHPKELNEDFFKSQYFSIRKGDVIALHPGFIQNLSVEEFKGSVSSIFHIFKKEDMKESLDVALDTNTEKINIYLNKNTYDSYYELRKTKTFDKYLAAVIVLPALTEALMCIAGDEQTQDQDSEYSKKRWYRQIKKKLDEKNISFESNPSLVKVANILLGDIISMALIDFNGTLNSINDGYEEIGGVD